MTTNIDLNALIQLITIKPLMSIVPYVAFIALFFILLDNKMVFKGQLRQVVTMAISSLWRQMPVFWQQIKKQYQEHESAAEPPSEGEQKIFAWAMMAIETAFAAIMFIYGIVFFALSLFSDISLLKLLLGISIGVAFIWGSRFYRLGALHTAKTNGINIYPWRNIN